MPQIPGYTLICPLGEGGMGHVYLAERAKDGLRCALKVLTLVDDGREQTEAITRFLEERELLTRIDHPNVARVFDHGLSDHCVFLGMEYFPCGDLKSAMERGISVPTTLNYIRQIADGLGKVHAHGIIHRDIKPANIMLRSDGTIALVDFGIAKAIDAVTTMTRRGDTIGTPHYMSPEQIKSEPPDARSDLYSLGVVFYEMLTHQRLFNGERVETILKQHLHAERPQLPAKVSILQPLLERLLAIDPAERFTDIADFLANFAIVGQLRFTEEAEVKNNAFAGIAKLDTLPKW